MADLRIMAFDPGIGKMGISVLDVTLHPLHVVEVYRETTDGAKLARTRKHLQTEFQNSYCALDALEDRLDELFDEFKPDEVVSEGAFSYKIPAAVISLTLVIGLIRRKSHRYLNKDVRIIAPCQSKRSSTGSGHADKIQMRKWYDVCPYIAKLDTPITEHEIDAVSHGIAYITRDVLKTLPITVSAKKKKKK